jgi:hypothetical protein
MGPLLIFDKSFLQMLNPDEVFELSLHFKFVGTPLLIREMIADLKKEPSPELVPRNVVKALAGKMETAHGIQPANFRKLALANLCAYEISMIGQVPVDASVPNVHVTRDGRGLLYDSVPEQGMWRRWAAENFTTEDEEIATAWRTGLEKVDLRAVGDGWKEFAKTHFGTAKNQSELIDGLDGMLSDPNATMQRELLALTLAFLRAPLPVRRLVFGLHAIGEISTIEEFAPFAASVTKLYLAFIGGLARGFVGPRPSHFIDLQYLFYAPFCMVFVSADKFHRVMWNAASGANSFVWGPDLKTELGKRVDFRREMSDAERKAKAKEYGIYPMEVTGSIINELWRKYMRPRKQIESPSAAKTFDDLDPETKAHIEEAIRIFDKGEA